MMKVKWGIVSVVIFLLSNHYFYLCAQERQDTRQEARQHYLQGSEYYSQGRYQEATSEFEKAIGALQPAGLEYFNKLQSEQKKVLAPQAPQAITLPQKIALEEKAKKKEAEAAIKEPGALESAAEAPEKEYYIDIGDVLDISVWQVPDLSRPEVIVRPDGKVSFPLIGDVKAEGLTLTQLDDIITEELKEYVKAPQVSIMMRRFGEQTNKVVILGEIPVPGIYKFSSPATITEVIASAGGYTKYAVLNSIMIIRGEVIKGRPKVNRVNLVKVLKSGRISENIFLKPNDIVYVPRSFIGNLNTFLEVMQPTISEYMQTLNIKHLRQTIKKQGSI